MSNMIRHPYHLVEHSPWPLISALGAFFTTTGMVKMFLSNSISLIVLGLMVILLTMYQWWRDISKEGANQGFHTKSVELGLRWGMLLFIVSEICFFVSFFWAFFHSSLAPAVELGSQWPPQGILSFHPLQVPLLNTIVLLSSGISVTWAHHALMQNNVSAATQGLSVTILLGAYFTFLQGLEYYEATFSLADSIYGTTFFVATGFHGLHVLIGTIFLAVCLNRLIMFNFSATHHFGFEAAAWYWHFVDVVWLFLYLSIYWWGNSH